MSEGGNKRPTDEQIAQRAYEIYIARGAEEGREIDDWLTAEKELSRQAFPSSETLRATPASQKASSEEGSQRDSAARPNRGNPPKKLPTTRAS